VLSSLNGESETEHTSCRQGRLHGNVNNERLSVYRHTFGQLPKEKPTVLFVAIHTHETYLRPPRHPLLASTAFRAQGLEWSIFFCQPTPPSKLLGLYP
jgi:hypothetical protein